MPFIVGVPRSGTTLLRLILDAHRELAMPPETGFLREAVAIARQRLPDCRDALLRLITGSSEWPDFGLDEADLARELRAAGGDEACATVASGLRAFFALYARRFGKPRYGDKTPGYLTLMPEIQKLLPEARFIHLVRDGRDVALSVRGLWFSPGQDMVTIAADWRRRIEQARRAAATCRQYLEVRYESLIHTPERELRRICDFLSLSYDSGMLEYHCRAAERLGEIQSRHRTDGTLLISRADRLRNQRFCLQPLDPTRVQRWKSEMTDEERQAFEAIAGELLEDLGYETQRQPVRPFWEPPPPDLSPSRPIQDSCSEQGARLRVLLTNNSLSERGGTELYLCDVARALLRRGHSPVVYSPDLGEVAAQLRSMTVPVVSDLSAVGQAPDVIHGQHALETLTALLRFPGVPAVFFCHGWNSWNLAPLDFARIRQFVAVDDTCRDRLLSEHAIRPEQMSIVRNFVDLQRFPPRPPLPTRPSRALAFGNDLRPREIEVLKSACREAGVSLNCVGRQSAQEAAHPELLLPRFDLVFAKGRCALEALAVGAAVIVCGSHGLGPLVTQANWEQLRRLNFGIRCQDQPLRASSIVERIGHYDAHDAAIVSAQIRAVADLERAVDDIVGIYHQVISAEPNRNDSAREGEQAAAFLSQAAAIFYAAPRAQRETERLREEVQHLLQERDATRVELARLKGSRAVRYAAKARRLLARFRSS